MRELSGTKIAVLGGSRGTGRVVSETLTAAGAQVLAIARGEDALALLKREQPAIETLALDVAEPTAPETVFAHMEPNVLVVCAGAKRAGSPFHELEWSQFSETWDVDVKASFLFCQAAIRRPLPPG